MKMTPPLETTSSAQLPRSVTFPSAPWSFIASVPPTTWRRLPASMVMSSVVSMPPETMRRLPVPVMVTPFQVSSPATTRRSVRVRVWPARVPSSAETVAMGASGTRGWRTRMRTRAAVTYLLARMAHPLPS